MSKMHESLIANEAEILAALPKELHESFKKELTATPAPENGPLSGDAEIAAIKAELNANPAVDEKAAEAELKEIKAPGRIAVPSEAEAEAEQAKLLAEVKAQIEKNA